MTTQLVPAELLQKADKILFVAHLALGDFTYMQSCFRAFTQAYPHIKVHLWVDELRRTDDETQWEHLKKYSLYDWVNSSSLFDKVYSQTYSPQLFEQSVKEAQAENYPIVISLAVLHRHKYVNLIRRLSPNGFIVGQKKRVRFYDIPKHLIYRKLDAFIPAYKISKKHQANLQAVPHISEIYAGWFHTLFNIGVSDSERLPYVDIPEKWREYAQLQFNDWGFREGQRVFFINGYSKSADRSWKIERVLDLAAEIKRQPAWSNAGIIINVVPDQMKYARSVIAQRPIEHVHLFSATTNFFQLPAILSVCNLIISVETAVMHLANAVHVPVIALMRQTSPEWVPIDASITTIIKVKKRKAWMDEITVNDVMKVLRSEE